MFVLLSFTFGRWMRANEMPWPDRETELKRSGEAGKFEPQAAFGKTQNLESHAIHETWRTKPGA
jgi:hypothetical protein